ncbi:MAG: EamA family transporter [Alphaproteobacteria bacterium]
MTQPAATLLGVIAILLWGSLALLTTLTGRIPPFQLTAMTFSIAALIAIGKWIVLRQSPQKILRQPWRVWLVGIGGLFGYHFFYFTALKKAPAAEASLISYLWPLLLVLFSGLLPGEKLRWFHIAGAGIAFLGAATLFVQHSFELGNAASLGYMAALVCAFIWSGYSVLSRGFREVPSDIIGGFCAATAILALICHRLTELLVWPIEGATWVAIVALGAGPVGFAFFAWDVGMKRGDIRLLGVLSYVAPALSTVLLIGFGQAVPSWTIVIGCILIVGGASLAALDKLKII